MAKREAIEQMGNEWRVSRTYFGNLEGVLRETEKQGYRILLIAQLDPVKTKQQFEVAVIAKRCDSDAPETTQAVPFSPQFGSFTSDRDSLFADQ